MLPLSFAMHTGTRDKSGVGTIRACIAEKPSVASGIALLVGATKNGYVLGQGVIVGYAFGHMDTAAKP